MGRPIRKAAQKGGAKTQVKTAPKTQVKPAPKPNVEEQESDEEIYVVEGIQGYREDEDAFGEYLIKWEGYDEATWEPKESVELIKGTLKKTCENLYAAHQQAKDASKWDSPESPEETVEAKSIEKRTKATKVKQTPAKPKPRDPLKSSLKTSPTARPRRASVAAKPTPVPAASGRPLRASRNSEPLPKISIENSEESAVMDSNEPESSNSDSDSSTSSSYESSSSSKGSAARMGAPFPWTFGTGSPSRRRTPPRKTRTSETLLNRSLPSRTNPGKTLQLRLQKGPKGKYRDSVFCSETGDEYSARTLVSQLDSVKWDISDVTLELRDGKKEDHRIHIIREHGKPRAAFWLSDLMRTIHSPYRTLSYLLLTRVAIDRTNKKK